jgi:long-chain acyl-CoA synthetase
MLAAGRVLKHCATYLAFDPKGPDDEYVSVLPLPWIMEQVYALGKGLVCRMKVNFVEEPETMMHDFREIAPTFVLFAPRLWESIAADVRAGVMDSSPLKQKLFDIGMKTGLSALAQGKHSMLADQLLFRALRDRLGFTRLRSAATGGAALGPDTFKFFRAMGVPLRTLYGQTEMLGAYTLHPFGKVDPDTTGVPMAADIEVRVDNPDVNGVGEIVVRHPNMFLGYYKNPEASVADVKDGWMHSGDAGYFNADRQLVIIDRIKDLAETSRGERFSPQYLENKLKFSPYIAERWCSAPAATTLAAMICIRYSIISKWAEKNRISFTPTPTSPRARGLCAAAQGSRSVNATLPPAQRISRFLLLYKELDADDGELTRTRKVRRSVINEKYADIIDAIYGGKSDIPVDTVIRFQDGTTQRIRTTLRVVDLGGDAPMAEAADEHPASDPASGQRPRGRHALWRGRDVVRADLQGDAGGELRAGRTAAGRRLGVLVAAHQISGAVLSGHADHAGLHVPVRHRHPDRHPAPDDRRADHFRDHGDDRAVDGVSPR